MKTQIITLESRDDLITGIGGKGGGLPNLAQGSLSDLSKVGDAMSKVAKAVEEGLK